MVLNKNVVNSNSFKYKISIAGSTYNVDSTANDDDGNSVPNPTYETSKSGKNEVEIAVLLKHLGDFWNSLSIPLVNCEVSLALAWSAKCLFISMEKRILVVGQQIRNDSPTNATFAITDYTFYVPVITLSAENDNKLLEQLKTRFKRTIKWTKHRSEGFNNTKNNNLNYLINPTFTKVNRLSVLSFENEEDRTSFSKYYEPIVEIKDFNVLIDRKSFFEIPRKNKEEAYE